MCWSVIHIILGYFKNDFLYSVKNHQPQNVSLRWGNQRLVRRISELIRRHDRQRLQRLERRTLPDGRADVSGDGELLASGAVLRVCRLQRGHGHHLRALLHVRNFLRFLRLQMFQGEKKNNRKFIESFVRKWTDAMLEKLGKLGVTLLEDCTKMDVCPWGYMQVMRYQSWIFSSHQDSS